jgi:hypothetical protein
MLNVLRRITKTVHWNPYLAVENLADRQIGVRNKTSSKNGVTN